MAEVIGLGVIFGLIGLVLWLRGDNVQLKIEKVQHEEEGKILKKQRDSSINNVDDAISMLTGKKRK